MTIIPISMKQANQFVTQHHRHSKSVRSCKFCIGVTDNETLIGVAIVSRPVSRHLDNGITAEVSRLCTDGHKNACSFLYSACDKIAKQMGYKKIQTYILEMENGASLKASNWQYGGICGGGNWNVKSRQRENTANPCKKRLYYKNL